MLDSVVLNPERKALFLDELSRHGIVIRAARAASPGSTLGATQTFRDERARDPEFDAAWDEAVESARAEVEHEVHRRAVEGWEEPVYQRGERVGTITKYSDRLLEIRVKALNPAYREHTRVDVSADVTARRAAEAGRVERSLELLTDDELENLRSLCERVVERQALALGEPAPRALPITVDVAVARADFDEMSR